MATNKNTMISNVVPYDQLRTVQLFTLAALRDAIINSFGPKGSNTMILKENMYPKYTKDGHEILEAVHFNNGIEQSVKENMWNLTAKIVKDVGDGTTSAVILSSIIFEKFCFSEIESKMKPFEVGQYTNEITKMIADEIRKNGRECKLEDIYDIAMISSNSNREVSENVYNIYKEHGMDVFVDVLTSMGQESYLKIMDGMTLPTGMMDTCFINNGTGKNAKCSLKNPFIYVFEDPVDTPEMMSFFDAILRNNIIAPALNGDSRFIPTVIMVPKLSKDTSAYLDKIVELMNQASGNGKPPLLIVSDIYDSERYTDISMMCGCRPIKKYIDPALQKKDIEDGNAPTPETVHNFCGRAEMVEATDEFTKFINPKNMVTPEGEQTEDYINLLASLQSKLERAEVDGSDISEIGKLKRRINSLKANMVEYYVGGISMTDREALRASVEDTIKNCRSAATYGVGYGANFEGLKASMKVLADLEERANTDDHARKLLPIIRIISETYAILVSILYMASIETTGDESEKATITDAMLKTSIEKGMPINLATGRYDGKVLSSIQSDIVILDTVCKIVTLMYTCNQCLMPTAYHNIYVEPKRYDGKDLTDGVEPVSSTPSPSETIPDVDNTSAFEGMMMPPIVNGRVQDTIPAMETSPDDAVDIEPTAEVVEEEPSEEVNN